MQLKYRAEINGLRGISVIAVVFYHAQFLIFGKDFFQGGFLGVDIFFVISGYLITSIILDEYYKYGKFSFKNFYLRRARRLLPALLVISFVSLIIGFAVLYPVAMKEFSNSVLASLLFVSNYFFHFEGQNYGADNSILQPFLHTWSLSVEEQFYIFFPIIIFICLRKFNDKLNFLLLLGFIISFFLCMIANQLYTSINFYSFPTRGWELLSGSILANLERKNYNFKFIHLSNKLSLLGLFLIIFSFLYFDFNNFSHPSLLTIIPVFGTMLIIWFCRDDNSFTGKILKNKYLVGVGLISYSLYLWHFPILSFLEISNLKVFTYHKIIFILVSIFLSIITYLYVEKPFRNAKIINSKNFLKLIFSMSGIILLFFLIYPKYHVEKYPSIYKDLGGKTWYTTRQFFKPCFQRKDYFCTFNNYSSKEKIFIVGDSVLASIQNELKIQMLNNDYPVVVMTNGGCDYIPSKLIFGKIFNNSDNCNYELQQKRKNFILSAKKSKVILYYNPRTYDKKNKEIFFQEIEKGLIELLNKGHQIFLIFPIPHFKKGFNYLEELKKILPANKNKAIKYLEENNDILSIDYQDYKKQNNEFFLYFKNFNHKNLIKIYPDKVFCNNEIKGKCLSNSKNEAYFVDDTHLSKSGGRLIGKKILEKLK